MAKVEGLAKLKRRLSKLPAKMRAEVKASLHKSADELVAMQKRLAPDDPRTSAPDLRTSIQKRDGRHELAVDVIAGSDDVFYARFVEFGTINQPAQPFFFPAYRSLRKRIKSRTTRAVRKAVRSNV